MTSHFEDDNDANVVAMESILEDIPSTNAGRAIALGLAMVADSIRNASYALGLKNANTGMGTLEAVGVAITHLADSVDGLAPR